MEFKKLLDYPIGSSYKDILVVTSDGLYWERDKVRGWMFDGEQWHLMALCDNGLYQIVDVEEPGMVEYREG